MPLEKFRITANVFHRIVRRNQHGTAGLGEVRMQRCMQYCTGRRTNQNALFSRQLATRPKRVFVADRDQLIEQLAVENFWIVLLRQSGNALQS